MTPKGNPKAQETPTNKVPNVPINPGSDPIFSYYSLLDSPDSLDNHYYKQRQHAERTRINDVVTLVLVT